MQHKRQYEIEVHFPVSLLCTLPAHPACVSVSTYMLRGDVLCLSKALTLHDSTIVPLWQAVQRVAFSEA